MASETFAPSDKALSQLSKALTKGLKSQHKVHTALKKSQHSDLRDLIRRAPSLENPDFFLRINDDFQAINHAVTDLHKELELMQPKGLKTQQNDSMADSESEHPGF